MQASIRDITGRRSDELLIKSNACTANELSEDRLHWIDAQGEPNQEVIDYVRLFDLTIVGQYENLTHADELELHPGNITYVSGKPILVVPKAFRPDAMLVFETKDEVTVVDVGEPHIPSLENGLGIEEVLQLRFSIRPICPFSCLIEPY